MAIAGEAWLRGLPALVGELSRRWNVTLGPPFELSYNYVAAARRGDGTAAVFKIGPWEDGEIGREIEALRLYGGSGACRLLESEVGLKAMLLERIRPGDTLVGVAARDDDAATRIGADVMRRLWRPAADLPDPSLLQAARRVVPPGVFSATARPTAGRDRSRRPFSSTPRRSRPTCSPPSPEDVLLHGDFHHYNVLSSERGRGSRSTRRAWSAILATRSGRSCSIPTSTATAKSRTLLERRLDIFAAELEYDRERLRDWAIAHAVLSACWSAENGGGGWQSAIAAAENLIAL